MKVSFALATLGVIAAVTGTGMVPSMADEDRYLQYLDEHGYHALYSSGKAVPRSSTIMYGHYICKNLHVNGDPGTSSVLPQYSLLVEAAQQTLCPDTLAGVSPS